MVILPTAKNDVIPAKAGIQRRASARHENQQVQHLSNIVQVISSLSLARVSRFRGNDVVCNRVAVLLTILFTLTACGFHPVYGGHGSDGSPVAEQLNQVAIDPIPDHPGQMLRNDLIDRIYGKGRPAQPIYHLSIKLRVVDEDIGVLANGTTSLADVHTIGDYALKDASGKVVANGTVESLSSYDKLTSIYSTLAAHDSALERSLRETSEQLTARLSLYFSERDATKKP